MKIEYLKRIKNLPEFAQDSLGGGAYLVNSKIIDRYGFDDKLSFSLSNIEAEILLKDIQLEEISDRIQKDLKLDKKSADEITLIILRDIFYPIKDYFPGIEDEIIKLGGEIPKEKPKKLDEQLLKREEEIEKMHEEKRKEEEEKMKDTIINKPIEELMKEFPQVGEQQIGSQKAINIKSMPVPMKPLIKYWIKDYNEKMGYYRHSNLERVQYVYHDKNTREMNEEERKQLNLILKSVDEGTSLPYSTRMGKIDFGRVNYES
jgi:hypothetical protein